MLQGFDKKSGFTEMYNNNFEYLYSFVFTRTAGDALACEEIVQDTFAAAWAGFDGYRAASTHSTWLCAIARNKLYDFYRRRSRDPVFDPDNEAEALPSDWGIPEAVLVQSEQRTQVIEALRSINPLYRYSLILKYIDICSVKQIASVLKRTPKAVDGILQRARTAFAKAYSGVCREDKADEG